MKTKGLLYGVAVNDVKERVIETIYVDGKRKKVYLCDAYRKWSNMLARCYGGSKAKYLARYKDVTVCDEWLRFSSFRDWMYSHDYEGMELDKDLKVDGNKVYSPDACLFIPHEINAFLVLSNGIRGNLPVGVCLFKRDNNYHSYIKHKGEREHIGYFSTPMEAHKAWQIKKLEFAVEMRDKQDRPEIIQGLNRVISKLEHHIANGIETTSL